MNIKSLYTTPSIEILELESEEVIASSLHITEDEITGSTRSRRIFWSSDNE